LSNDCHPKKKNNNNKAKLRPALYVRTNAGKKTITPKLFRSQIGVGLRKFGGLGRPAGLGGDRCRRNSSKPKSQIKYLYIDKIFPPVPQGYRNESDRKFDQGHVFLTNLS
jgi:hypothetical protein